MGSLFRNPSAPSMGTATPKVEAGALQMALNEMGQAQGADWHPLKIDDWPGPKTTEAFRQVARAGGADELTHRYARNLGLG